MAEEEKKELPPIVKVSEKIFTETKLDPAYKELVDPLAKDVLGLDKAQTFQILVKSTARETEEIKDEVMLPFWEKKKPLEEGKEAISFEDAREVILLYAVSIGLIPTRLDTALELYSDEFTKPEREITQFCLNDSLHDVTLLNPRTGATYK